MYKRILLAADGSNNSVRAAKEAAKIASLIQGSMIEIFYVADMSKVKSEVLHSVNQDEIKQKRLEKLRPVIQEIGKLNVNNQTKIIVGDPGPAIVEYANKELFDLVVIGNRGLNTLQEFVMGSVSHKVVKRVQCPVIVVK
ncbi:universal stress protein [Escherichia coli]|nr:universal stress protein [Escherichia coli]